MTTVLQNHRLELEVLHNFPLMSLSNLPSSLLPPHLLQPWRLPAASEHAMPSSFTHALTPPHLEFFHTFYWVSIEPCSDISSTLKSCPAPFFRALPMPLFISLCVSTLTLAEVAGLQVLLSPLVWGVPRDSILAENFGFGVAQLGSNLPLTCSSLVILTAGNIINLSKPPCSHPRSKSNNTYLSKSLKELNEILYIQQAPSTVLAPQ